VCPAPVRDPCLVSLLALARSPPSLAHPPLQSRLLACYTCDGRLTKAIATRLCGAIGNLAMHAPLKLALGHDGLSPQHTCVYTRDAP